LERHLPVVLGSLQIIQSAIPNARALMVLPSENLAAVARIHPLAQGLEIRCGGLAEALASADLAIASTGTVTMECAFFRVPTVTLYKTSWSTFQIGKRIVKVKSLTMPNLLAGAEVFHAGKYRARRAGVAPRPAAPGTPASSTRKNYRIIGAARREPSRGGFDFTEHESAVAQARFFATDMLRESKTCSRSIGRF
jgi:hypothetical protein